MLNNFYFSKIELIMVACIMAFVAFRIIVLIKKHCRPNYNDMLIFLYCIGALVIIRSYFFTMGIAKKYGGIGEILIGFVAIAVVFGVVLVLTTYMSNQSKKETKAKLMKMQLSMQEEHYKDLKESYSAIEMLKNDYNTHLNTLQNLKNGNDYKKLGDCLDDICGEIKKYESITYCTIAAVDAVLYNKRQTASKKGINLHIESEIINEIKVSSFEISSVVANLIDNAIEACERDGGKIIDFRMFKKMNYLVISVVNPCKEYSAATVKSDKKNHGLGMKIIAEIVKKYNGNETCKFTGSEFYHIVNLSLE